MATPIRETPENKIPTRKSIGMAASIRETPEVRNPRRKSINIPVSPSRGAAGGGSSQAGGKARRYSIATPTSRKSTGEEGNISPNYLRASTGSCHDLCKYGSNHAQEKSRSPVIPKGPKRAAVVNKEKVPRTVVPVDRMKTTVVTKPKPSPDPKIHAPTEVIKREIALTSKKVEIPKGNPSTNRKVPEKELKMRQQRSTSELKPKPKMVNSSSSGPDASNGRTKKKDITTVNKTEIIPKTATVKKVEAKGTPSGLLSPKPSVGRVGSLKVRKDRNLKLVSPLKDKNTMPKIEFQQSITGSIEKRTLDDVEAESKAKLETLELESFHPSTEIIQSPSSLSMELTNPPVSESSQSPRDKEVLEESSITSRVSERYESSSDKEVIEEESSIAPPVSVSSQFSSDKEVLEEESSIVPPVSVSSESYKEVLEEESSIAPPVSAISKSPSEKEVLEEESSIVPPVSVSSESSSDKEVLEEESSIAPPVSAISKSPSEKEVLEEESSIVPPVSVSSESYKEVLEEESSIAPPVSAISKSPSEKEVLEEESSIVPPVSVSSESSSDKEVLEEESSLAPPVSAVSKSSSDKEVLEEESSILPPVLVSSQSYSDKEVLEEESSSITPPGSERFRSSEKEVLEKSSIAPPVSQSSQSSSDREVLEIEEESEYSDDEEVQSSYGKEVLEEEFEYTDNEEGEEEIHVSKNDDEMGTSVGNHKRILRKGRVIVSEGTDDAAVKLKFRRGKVLDVKPEENGPRRLKFRRGRVVERNKDGQNIARKTLKKRDIDKDRTNDREDGSGSVVLKHQDVQDKKDAQGLYNNVIEETASKLAESRKSKVKALVGAFETVICLQDGNPSST